MRYHIRFPTIALGCLAACLGLCRTQAQSLTVTSGLQLWLKADAGVTVNGPNVASWTDQSPNHLVASALDVPNAPLLVANALNGNPVVRFDGDNDYLSIPDDPSISIAGDLTTFFVVKFDDFDTFRAVWAKTANNLPGPTDFYILPGSGIPQVYRGDGTAANLGSLAGTTPLVAGAYLTVGFGMEGTTCTHYLADQATGSGEIAALTADADTALLIGTRGDLFTKMKGDIAEIVIYDRSLTAVERASVVDYLGKKYNIANLPPTVSLAVSPAGPTVAPGDVVTLTATPKDADGSVAAVRFFANGALVGTATAAPYKIGVKVSTPADYVFSARAVDDKGATGDSATVTRTVVGGIPVALTAKSSLQLWLKADAGVATGTDGIVTTWADQSGKGNDATSAGDTTSPTVATAAINSLPTIHFDGDDDLLTVADSASVSITGDITSFFVVRMDDFSTYRAVWAKTAGNLPAPEDYYTLPGSGIPRAYRGDGTAVNIASVDGASPLRAGSFDVAGFSAAGAAFTHYLNGAVSGTGTSTTSTADLDNPLLIGTRGDGVTKLKGDLAELLVFDTALTGADVDNVQLYLAGKYGLPISAAVNGAPTVSLTGPADGTAVTAPADVTMTADAGDADGSVTKVEFLANGALIGTSTTAPYTATVKFSVASSVSLTARVTDNLGGVTVSAPVALTVRANDPIPLPSTATLSLWLRADKGVTETAGAVSGWDDQSGNFNNGAQATVSKRPVLVSNAANGNPVIRFDGTDDFLAVTSSDTLAITGDISTFFVVKFDDFTGFRAVWAKTAGNQPAPTDFYTLPDSGLPRVFRGNGSTAAGFVDAVAAPNAGEYAIIGFDMAGPTLHHYLNGVANGQGDITSAIKDTGAPLLIGTRGDQFTRMKGDIAEIIIYKSALSDADRAAVFSYLGTRYGVTIPPRLQVSLGADGKVTLTWPGGLLGFVLESTPDLVTPWAPVQGAGNVSYSEVPTGTKLFRLNKQ